MKRRVSAGILYTLILAIGCLSGGAWAANVTVYGSGARSGSDNYTYVTGTSIRETIFGTGQSYTYRQGTWQWTGSSPSYHNWNGLNSDSTGNWAQTGDDTLNISGGVATGSFEFGNGVNTININATPYGVSDWNSSILSMGSGNNSLNISAGGNTVNIGGSGLVLGVYNVGGTSTVTVSGSSSFSAITNYGNSDFTTNSGATSTVGTYTGSGATDIITVTGGSTLQNTGNMNLGAGSNTMNFNGTTNIGGALSGGGGNDTLNIANGYTTTVSGGNGVDFGHGTNQANINGTLNVVNGGYTGGNGLDSFKVLNTGSAQIAGTMDLGNGNNTVDLAGNTTMGAYKGGSGHDIFNTSGNAILTVTGDVDLGFGTGGSGSMHLNGNTANIGGDIKGGDGGNTIIIDNANLSTISGDIILGNGVNYIQISSNTNVVGSVYAGASADYFTVDAHQTINASADINLQGGNNEFIINGTLNAAGNVVAYGGHDYFVVNVGGAANITGDMNLGAGNNTWDIHDTLNVTNGSSVYGLDGNDVFNVTGGSTTTISGHLDLGAGNNTMNMGGTVNITGDLKTDTGNDTLNIAASHTTTVNGATGVDLGNGANNINVNGGTLNVSSGDITMGIGDDRLFVDTGSDVTVAGNIYLGNGNNTADLRGDVAVAGGTGSINFGSTGIDTIIIGNTGTTPTIDGYINAGGGNDNLYGFGGTITGSIDMGNGNNNVVITGGQYGTALAAGDESLHFDGGNNAANITGGRFYRDVNFGGGNNGTIATPIVIAGNSQFDENLIFGNGTNVVYINTTGGIADQLQVGSGSNNRFQIVGTNIVNGISVDGGTGNQFSMSNVHINTFGMHFGAGSDQIITADASSIDAGGFTVGMGDRNQVGLTNSTVSGDVTVGNGNLGVVVVQTNTIDGDASVGHGDGRLIGINNNSITGDVTVGIGANRTIDIHNNSSISGTIDIGHGTDNLVQLSNNTAIGGDVHIGTALNGNHGSNITLIGNNIAGDLQMGGGDDMTVGVGNGTVNQGIVMGDGNRNNVTVDNVIINANGVAVGNGSNTHFTVNNSTVTGDVAIGNGSNLTVDVHNNANIDGNVVVGHGADNQINLTHNTLITGNVLVGAGSTDNTNANVYLDGSNIAGRLEVGGGHGKTITINAGSIGQGVIIGQGDNQKITIGGGALIATNGVDIGDGNNIYHDLSGLSNITGDYHMGQGDNYFNGPSGDLLTNAHITGNFGKTDVQQSGKTEIVLGNGSITGNVTLGSGDNLLGIAEGGSGRITGSIETGIGNDRLLFYDGAVTGNINVGSGKNTLHFVNNTMQGNITDDNSANQGGKDGTNEILFSGNAGSYSNGVITMSNGKNVTQIEKGFNMEGGRPHTYGDGGNKFFFYDGVYGSDGNNVDFTSGNGDDLFVFDGNRNGANTNMFLNVTSKSGNNKWYIQSGTLQGTLNAQNGANYFEQTGGIITKDSSQNGGLVLIEGHNAQNEYYLTGTGIVAPDGEIQVTTTATVQGGSSFYFHQDAGTFSGTLYSYGTGGLVNNDTRNIIHFTENANFTRSAKMYIDGIDNEVVVNLADSAPDFAGHIDLSRSIGTNEVFIANGNLTNSVDGSFHGSNNSGSQTNYWVTGGETWQTYGGQGGSHLDMYAGNVWNHQGNDKGSSRELPTGVDADNMNSAKFYNDGDYHMYSLLNMDTVTLTEKANLTIGRLNRNGNPDNPLGSRAQITANRVDVNAGSKLRIHEDRSQFNLNGAPYTPGNADPTKQYANIVNEMNITGTVTIDRTTIQGTNPGEAVINVAGGGILHGFSRKESSNFWDGAPNLIGDLNLYSGSILRPYDSSIFDIVNPLYRGAVFEVQADAGTGKGGVSTFYGGSTLSTRLFADPDGKSIAINGVNTATNYSDSLKSLDVDFSSIGVKPAEKVQYDPIFGYRNELKSKLDYLIYQGDGTIENDNTYYGTVVESSFSIPELAGYDDANHLFNREILKSDMLGEWWFEKATSNVTDDSVVVRFRLLAAHPADGGIAKVMEEPNAKRAARMIDIIRYPFQNDYNDLSPAIDPTADGKTSSNPEIYAPADGYNGNMREFYAEAYKQNPEIYSNYNDQYIKDWENLLLGMQKSSISAGVLNEDVRQLHPEAYASMVNVNLQLMDQFNRTREQHAMSSVFQVENTLYAEAVAMAEGSDYAYASLDDCGVDQFVCNPIRFWAAGFGSTGNQKKDGYEYGFDTDVWGGALGVVKECGDWYFGVTGGYARVDAKWKELRATAKNDAYMVQAHAGLRLGLGFVEAYANYAYNNQNMTRDIVITSYSGIAKGDYHDDIYGGGIRAGYQLVFGGKWLLVPTIGLSYTSSENGSFSEESGRAFQSTLLRFRSGDIKRRVVKMPISLRLNRSFALGSFVLTPEVRASFSPVFGNKNAKATTEFVGNPVPGQYFYAVGIDNGRYVANVGTSLELSRHGRFFLSGNYDYTFRRKSHEHNYSIMTGLNF